MAGVYQLLEAGFENRLSSLLESAAHAFHAKISICTFSWNVSSDMGNVFDISVTQLGYLKLFSILFDWETRNRGNHYWKKRWLLRQALSEGERNVTSELVVNPDSVEVTDRYVIFCLIMDFWGIIMATIIIFMHLRIRNFKAENYEPLYEEFPFPAESRDERKTLEINFLDIYLEVF